VGLQLNLLGRFRAAVDGVPVADGAWRRRKAAVIVKLLALQPSASLHRDQVLDLLWPQYDVEAALNNFHQALHVARRALEPERRTGRFLRWRGAILELSPDEPIASDVATFLEGAAAARASGDPQKYAAAVALYSGDLLIEDVYEDWSIPPRESLRTTYLDLLRRSVELLQARGDTAAAVETAGRLVAAEPLDEAAQLQLVELLAAAGRRREARQQLDRFRQTLRRELDVDLPRAALELERSLLGSALAAAHAVQAPPTRFVGRRRELQAVAALLRRSRLVTLVGPGGGGKSRLAAEVVAGWVATSSDGVGIVDLAAVDRPGQVPAALARDLGADGHAPPLEAVIRRYQQRQSLILLDNCEHVIEAAAGVAERLLRACPQLRILATSREPLALPGETVWRIPPLVLPAGPEDAAADAVQLFLDRARLHAPGFDRTAENAAAIAEICHRLDGLPLAIELAAARVGSLTPAQIAARLVESLAVLDGGNRAADRRHRTLAATLDWSYVLLTPEEQAVLRRLAILGDEFGLEVAEQICAFGALAGRPIVSLLGSLVDKSLVSADLSGSESRYRLSEVVRQFAAARLSDAEAQEARRRWRAWAFALAEAAAPRLGDRDERLWLDRLEREYAHLRAALDDALDAGAFDEALEAGGNLWRFWQARGRLAEGLRWLTDALARDGGAPRAARARALNGAGGLANDLGDHARAAVAHEECLAIWRALGHPPGIASSLNNLGNVARKRGDLATAERHYAESLRLFEALGDVARQALVLLNTGRMERRRGRTGAAEAAFERSLALYRQSGDLQGVASALNRLGDLARERGDIGLARTLHDEALAIHQQRGDRWGQAIALNYLALAALGDDDPAGATALAQGALRLLHDLPLSSDIDISLSTIARAQIAVGRCELGATLLGAADALRLAAGEHPPPAEDDDLAPARRAGRLLALERAIALALDAPALDARDPLPRHAAALASPTKM
jgi:predicted ATPase/DNA-binding SARP family transcriptional activator